MASDQKIGGIYVEFQVNDDKAKKQLDDVKKQASDTGKKIEEDFKKTKLEVDSFGMQKALDGVIGKFAAMATATYVFKKAWDFVSESISSFESREKSMRGVESTIKSMGKEGEITASGMLAMAKNLASVNKFSIKVDDILDVQGFLLSFEKINKDILPRTSQVVIDLAAKMGTDLKSAAMSVGIALDNPAEGLTRLGRAGIKFTKDEKEVIQSLVETGHAGEAQDKIFDLLEKKVGGYAKNIVTPIEEMENRISAAFGAIKRDVGGAIVGFANFFITTKDASQAVDGINKNIGQLTSKIMPLADEYDILSKKSSLSANEQKRLTSILSEVSGAVPSAVTQWDAYGRAISLSTDAVRELIKAQKEELKVVKEDEINEYKKKLATIKSQISEISRQIDQGTVRVITTSSAGGVVYQDMPMANETKDDLKRQRTELGNKQLGIETHLKSLQGESLASTPATAKGEDKSVGAKIKTLEKDILELTAAYAKLDATDRKGQLDNLKLQKQKNDEINALNNKPVKETHEPIKGLASMERDLKASNATWKEELDRIKGMRAEVEDINNKEFQGKGGDDKRKTVLDGLKIAEDKIYKDMAKAELAAQKMGVEGMADGVDKKKALAEVWRQEEYARIANEVRDEKIALDQQYAVDKQYYQKLGQIDADSAKEKETISKQYASEMAGVNREMVEQDIRDHKLSSEAYKNYLKAQTDLYIQELEKRNEAWRKLDPKSPQIDTGAARKGREGQDALKSSDYDEAGNKKNDNTLGTVENIKNFQKGINTYKGIAEGAANDISNTFGSAVSTWLNGQESFAEATKHVWKNLANAVIGEIAAMAARWLAFKIVAGIFSGGASEAVSPFLTTAHDGGNFLGSSGGITKLASGGSFTVPSGYPHDSYPMFVESGEMVSVTPAYKAGDSERAYNGIAQSIQALNMNLMQKQKNININPITLDSRIDGNDLYLTNKNVARIQKRYNQ